MRGEERRETRGGEGRNVGCDQKDKMEADEIGLDQKKQEMTLCVE